jgi:hypothetical protein
MVPYSIVLLVMSIENLPVCHAFLDFSSPVQQHLFLVPHVQQGVTLPKMQAQNATVAISL